MFTKNDVAVKSDPELKSEIHWLVPNAQKNSMEPIVVYLEPQGRTYLDDPHDGEEFGYVIKGQIQLHFGSEVVKVRAGESFYFLLKQAIIFLMQARGKQLCFGSLRHQAFRDM